MLANFRRLNFWQKTWFFMPVAIWFSYLPQFYLGGDKTMNYELSITELYVVFLGLVSLPIIVKNWRTLIHSPLAVVATLLYAWSGLSAIWSSNPVRGVLTFGLASVIWLVLVGALAGRRQLKDIAPQLVRFFLLTAIIASSLAILQAFLGTFITDNKLTGLCLGCSAGQFGFVRPNLFAIEPQFLGNMLIAPALIWLYRLITRPRTWRDAVPFVLVLTTIGLTLSRGAIYAFIIGAIVEVIVSRGHRLNKLASLDLMIVSVILCLTLQGGLGAINPHVQETFGGAVAKSIDHLTLDTVDLRGKEFTKANDFPAPTSLANKPEKPAFNGYVAESTNTRINLSTTALNAWLDQPAWAKLAGTGYGSAGRVMAQQIGSSYEKEIVQNQYVETLLERGVIGLGLLLATLGVFFTRTKQHRWVWSIAIAFGVQYCFFSGLPNAIHVYLILIVLYCAAASKHLPNSFEQNLDIQ